MNLIHANNRWEQLRAVEADLLSPPPADPFQCYPEGWSRAADLKENEWERIPLREKSVSPAPRAHSPGSFRRAIRRVGQARQNRPDPVQLPERRARQPRQEAPAENAPEVRRRAISPTQLPGVRAIPKDYNRFFRGLLTPGEYFAKSQTRYLGPFETMPTVETLPSDDEYVILQRMGRLPDSGKSIFRQVGSLSTRITN
ncbi:hypothetical protein B9Z55_009336 [Caenorhabditis nigoni]|uniref:Uncharacterized protein n=1 Tax=Caenorhabditis nigoni TaxID=1611254 RepID=A0A2G5URJ4_9PELO|nr:hypothetical protein B9Z55_009336 [Caenorhabditis nigoni]